MMNKYFHINKILFGISIYICSLFLFSSCEDEYLYDPNYIGKGEANIDAEVTFYHSIAELSRADGDNENPVKGGTPGNAIGEVKSLEVLMYNLNGELVKSELADYKYEEDYNKDTSSDAIPEESEGNIPHQAEEATRRATFTLNKVPFGKYHIYAVVNMGDLATDETEFVNNEGKSISIKDAIQKEEGLKDVILKWKDEVAENNQMFGYFTLAENEKSSGFGPVDLIINRPQIKLHSWLKRAVSKVTVAFDGTNLHDNVEIFIRSVEIRDIPTECFLGANNSPDKNDILIDASQEMTYGGTGDPDDKNWIGYISNKHPINGYDQSVVNDNTLNAERKLAKLHSETTNAFFFFENMQGKGEEGTPSDKHQQVKESHKELGVVSYPNGSDPNDPSGAWKDSKKYGTYIVVRAYYKSNDKNEGQGEIIYRFMLGKDTHLDYDAERNYHYKLTLCFNGWANDVDWHIDYRKDSDKDKLRIPNPFYISYLYGQSGMLPLEFDADKDVTIKQIDIEITSNNWGPGNTPEYGADLLGEALAGINTRKYFNTYYLYLSNKAVYDPINYPWNGFLSVIKPKNINLISGSKPFTVYSNKEKYEEYSQNKRTYRAKDLGISNYEVYTAETEDKPHVAWEDGTYYVKLPIWTRARNLITETGYTGNNPYSSYFRLAKMKVTVTLVDKDGKESKITKLTDSKGNEVDEVTIQQVRRIVNPKGVYRKGDNNEEFRVTLMALEDENDNVFDEVISDGPWRAYVLQDSYFTDTKEGKGGFIYLTGNRTTTNSDATFEYHDTEEPYVAKRPSIEGVGNTPIDFTINFNGKAKDDHPGYAIIRVEYNNYSCYHLIFVRQGYGADDILEAPGGQKHKWMVFNQISDTETATDPRDEGSLFKYGNWAGIKAEDNQNGKSWNEWIKITPNDFLENLPKGKKFVLSDNTTICKYSDIQTNAKFSDENLKNMRVATQEDFQNLVFNTGSSDPNQQDQDSWKFPIKIGVGVLYADGAKTTRKDFNGAYGYIADTPGCEKKGMRGVFVYDMRNGENIFFPIGNSGYGHRKANFTNGWEPYFLPDGYNKDTLEGLLRYSTQARWGYFNVASGTGEDLTYPGGALGAPLFLDIFRSEGAIYYTDGEIKSNMNGVRIGWDMNYRTLNFESITSENLIYGKDACFVRCIAK